jgi:hypothetical protein
MRVCVREREREEREKGAMQNEKGEVDGKTLC